MESAQVVDAPAPPPREGVPSRVWSPATFAVAAFLVAWGVRSLLVVWVPANFAFDAYQRWAGRGTLLVQGWLPATQGVIHLVDSLGGGVVATRIVLSALAAVGVAAGALAADKLGGRVAGWTFVGFSCFAPALVWTGAMYQEGTYLAVLYLAVSLAVHDRMLAADLAIGAVGLVRYEGWPAVLLWLAWRRDPRALTACWGIAAWLLARYALGVRGHAFSPVDFDDWEGLAARTTLASWLHDAWKWSRMEWLSGGVTVLGFAAFGAWWRWRDRWVAYMLLNLGAQLAALAGWLAGLEVATYRMLVVPTAVAALPAALGAGLAWERWPRMRPALGGALAVFLGVAFWEAEREARVEARVNSFERHAAKQMRLQCEDCRWAFTPRTGIGTRDRHDGCEVLQGTTGWRHGQEFVCTTWPDAGSYPTTGTVSWTGMGYAVRVDPLDATADGAGRPAGRRLP